MIKKNEKLPNVTFKTRVRDESIEGPNPYRWEDKTTEDYFGAKKAILFGLPGAFTPTCSTYQLPGFEEKFDDFAALGIQEIYCTSVNDAFVMNAWAKDQGIEKVKVIPDGSAMLANGIGAAVAKDNLGFGIRSWRYALVVEDCVVKAVFAEAGQSNDCEDDPYEISTPENVYNYCLATYGG